MKMAYSTQVRHGFGYCNIFLRVKCKMFFWIYLCSFMSVSIVSATDYCLGHFDNCICTDDMVECHNETKLHGDIVKLFHFIKDDVSSIKIIGSKLKELPPNTFGSCRHDTSLVLQKLKLVDFSDNGITEIHGQSFHCAPYIETLILNNNEWKVDRHINKTGYFSSIGSLKHLYMNNTFEEVWDGTIHLTKLTHVFHKTDMTQLETLAIGGNEFMSLSLAAANSLCQLTSLKTLDLSRNSLRDPFMPDKNNCLLHLEKLDFSYNDMPILSKEFTDGLERLIHVNEVKLDNNPYICDCGLVDTWKWLNSTTVPVNKQELKCTGGYHSSYLNKPILSLSLSDLKCLELKPPSSSAVKVVVGIIFTVIGLTFVAFLIVHRERVKLLFKKWKKRLPNMRFRSHQGYASVQEVAVI